MVQPSGPAYLKSPAFLGLVQWLSENFQWIVSVECSSG